MSDQVYSIYDVNGYVSQMREAAAKSISENSSNNDLDTYITIDQMIGLVKSNCLGYDENNNPHLSCVRTFLGSTPQYHIVLSTSALLFLTDQ